MRTVIDTRDVAAVSAYDVDTRSGPLPDLESLLEWWRSTSQGSSAGLMVFDLPSPSPRSPVRAQVPIWTQEVFNAALRWLGVRLPTASCDSALVDDEGELVLRLVVSVPAADASVAQALDTEEALRGLLLEEFTKPVSVRVVRKP